MPHRNVPLSPRDCDLPRPGARLHRSPPSRLPPAAPHTCRSAPPSPRRQSECSHSPAPHIPASQTAPAIPSTRTQTRPAIRLSGQPPLSSCTPSDTPPSASATAHPTPYIQAANTNSRSTPLRHPACISKSASSAAAHHHTDSETPSPAPAPHSSRYKNSGSSPETPSASKPPVAPPSTPPTAPRNKDAWTATPLQTSHSPNSSLKQTACLPPAKPLAPAKRTLCHPR